MATTLTIASPAHAKPPAHVLIPGDYNGDGKTDAALYRPSTKTWHVWHTGGSAGVLHTWGNTGDIPVIPHAARRTIPTT